MLKLSISSKCFLLIFCTLAADHIVFHFMHRSRNKQVKTQVEKNSNSNAPKIPVLFQGSLKIHK